MVEADNDDDGVEVEDTDTMVVAVNCGAIVLKFMCSSASADASARVNGFHRSTDPNLFMHRPWSILNPMKRRSSKTSAFR